MDFTSANGESGGDRARIRREDREWAAARKKAGIRARSGAGFPLAFRESLAL
jgi:hypothetical protein